MSPPLSEKDPAGFAKNRPVGEHADWVERMQPITPREYLCHRAVAPIKIDGVIDAAAWSAAPWTSDFVDIEGEIRPSPRFRTRVKMLWDDEYLYIAAEMEEPHVWATLTEHDSVIFQDPDFEVFIDPKGTTQPYYEFEMNALNTTWDLQLDKPYMDNGKPDNSWEIPGAKTAVHIDGTLNDPFDTDKGWTVELAFPWSVLSERARHPGPPVEGEQWRINFSRVEWQISTEDGVYRKLPETPEDNWVWSPQGVVDMHRPEMWGVVQFTYSQDELPVTPIRGKEAHDLALEVYYAQREFHKAHGRWAGCFDELGASIEPPNTIEAPIVELTENGYICSVVFWESEDPHVWRIRQDRLLSLDEPTPL